MSLIGGSKILFLLGIVDSFFLLAGLVADRAAGLASGLAAGLALAATHDLGLSLCFCYGADMLHIFLLASRRSRRSLIDKIIAYSSKDYQVFLAPFLTFTAMMPQSKPTTAPVKKSSQVKPSMEGFPAIAAKTKKEVTT